MKGFKDSSRMRSGFNFSQGAGFTGSTGKTQNISYTRKTPHRKKFAEGGKVPPVRGSSVKGKTMMGALRDSVMPKTSPRVEGINRQVDRVTKAQGGKIDSALHSFKDDSQLNSEYGPTGGLRPGFTRGGMAPKYAKGGRIPAGKPAAAAAVAKHVATPAPRGHKGLKGC